MGTVRKSARSCATGLGVATGIVTLWSVAGCTAVLDGGNLDGPEGPKASAGGNGAVSGAGGGGAVAGAGASAGSTPADAPGYKPIHRLNTVEYNATVADVLGTKLQPASGNLYEIGGFDNLAEAQQVDNNEYQRFYDAAGTLADDAFSRAEFKSQWVTCTTSDDDCVSGIIGKLGLRLLRRPLTDLEVSNYQAVYAAAQGQGENHEGALEQVLRALLASSEFLYRMEFDADPASPAKHPLSSYELASRLSYFLWSSAPDDALLAAAADDSIERDETINATVSRLLADPVRGRRFVQNFYGQWLGARNLSNHAVAPDVYTTWGPELASALSEEMYDYFADFVSSDRSWLEFLTTDENFIDARLANFYGMPAPSGSGRQKVQFTSDKRVGFLGLGGFLALSSMDRRTSPTLRGRWLSINLLCTHPLPPPATVPKIEVAAGATDLSQGNVRAILEKHRKDPGCSFCHRLVDPYGLPLEQFDGIGAYRETYRDGSTIVPDTELPDGTQLTGLRELASAVTKDPRYQSCIVENLYAYGLGRVRTDADAGAIGQIRQTWNNTKDAPSIKRLVEVITLDAAFRSRSGQAL